MTEQEKLWGICDKVQKGELNRSEGVYEIYEIIKQGYVRLAEKQNLSENPFNYEDECREYTSYSNGQQDMLKANFRKVEL